MTEMYLVYIIVNALVVNYWVRAVYELHKRELHLGGWPTRGEGGGDFVPLPPISPFGPPSL